MLIHHFSLNDIKLQNALRTTKARVDTQWKKTTTTTTTSNGPSAASKTNAVTGEVQKSEINVAGVGQRKVLTRSNSVRLATSNKATGSGLQRHGSSHLIVGQKTTKTTLTTKVVENKVQQVKSK